MLIQSPFEPDQQLMLRTVLYWVAILTLPLTNLIRHIQLRLNQTMPTPTPAKNRYVLTVLVSILLCESIGLYGLLLFCVGDGFNTFIIFTGLSALGMFLYRPKQARNTTQSLQHWLQKTTNPLLPAWYVQPMPLDEREHPKAA